MLLWWCLPRPNSGTLITNHLEVSRSLHTLLRVKRLLHSLLHSWTTYNLRGAVADKWRWTPCWRRWQGYIESTLSWRAGMLPCCERPSFLGGRLEIGRMLPWTSWSLPALKKHWTGDFDSVREMTSERSGNWTGFTSGALALRSYIHQDVGEPTCVFFSTGCMQDNHLSVRSFYLQEFLCRREEELSAPRISLFWKRSVSLRFLDVFFVWVLC